MKYIKEIEDCIICECESCGRKVKISTEKLNKVGYNFTFINEFVCKCGKEHSSITKLQYQPKTVVNNNSNLMNCPVCSRQVSIDATTCIYCGHPFKHEKKMGFWKVVLAIIVALIIISFL